MRRAVRVDKPDALRVLERHRHVGRRLEDLKRKRHVHDARHAWQIALRFRIGGRAIGEVLLLPLERPGLVGDLVAFNDSLAGGHAQPRGVVLDLPRRGSEHLPDALQIGPAVGRPWNRAVCAAAVTAASETSAAIRIEPGNPCRIPPTSSASGADSNSICA